MTIVYSAAVKRAAILMALGGLFASLAGRCAAAILEFPIPTPVAFPQGITSGPDGAYWICEINAGNIARCNTNGVITEYPISFTEPRPYDIANGLDGSNLWFTEASYSAVGRISTNGTIQQFAIPSMVVTGTGITRGPDGRLWLLDYGAQEYIPGTLTNGGIVALTLSNSVVVGASYYNSNLTVHSRPVSITTGPDGNLYFTEQLAGKIGRITTNGVITEAAVTPTNTQPLDITTGPDGALWFTQAATNALGRIDTNLNITQFNLPTNTSGGAIASQPNGIVLGKDGNLYYTDSSSGFLGLVTVSGTNINVVQYYTPTVGSLPWRVATGPDGNIWFGEFNGNAMAEFLLPVPLNIQFTNNVLVISWSTNVGTHFSLQASTNLNTTNWVSVTNVPVPNTNTGNFVVNIVPTNSFPTNMLFFRLID